MQIKASLFDIDGTLVDSNDMHVLAWEEAFAGIDVTFDRQVVHDQIGKGADMLIPTLLPDLDEAAQEKLGEAHGRIFKAKFLSNVRPFAQAHDLLAHAHGLGQQVVLALSASKAELEHYLDLLDARFDFRHDERRRCRADKAGPRHLREGAQTTAGDQCEGSFHRWRHTVRHRGWSKMRDRSRGATIG